MATKVIADRLCRLPCEVVDFTAGQDCDEGQDRYSFLVRILHSLLHAGLSRRTEKAILRQLRQLR
jgi:hypothetical protein